MRKRLGSLFVTCLLGTGLVLAAEAVAEEGTDCVSGVLATDVEGDGTYAGQAGTGLESSSADLTSVSTSLAPPAIDDGTGDDGKTKKPKNPRNPKFGETETPVDESVTAEPGSATFTAAVADLAPTDPQHFDLVLNLEILTDAGDVITMDARRSAVLGETGTVNGSSEGVTAEFDELADEIRLTVPSAAFDGVNTVALQLAQTRYDSGAVLSPLADEASGTCSITLTADYTPPTGEDFSALDTKILVIDTGVNGQHPEFADGQIFAWWDFSAFGGDTDPGTRTWFDTNGNGVLQGDRDDPYDPNGHGSSVSSMAAGSNAVNPAKTPSGCPGCALAVAKVQDEEADSLNGSIGNAIRWGVDVLDVDVITVSIGSRAPLPRLLVEDTYSAIDHARAAGVLVLFANGNGWGNAGVPGQPGGFMNYGNSTNALSVGANDLDSFLVTTDPEVVAVFSVHAAGPEGSGYQDISGTSFSAPFTAGVAARIIGEGRACGGGYDDSPDSIEDLIKFTAADRPDVPPTFEGYGEVTLDTMAHAIEVACGREPLPEPDALNHFYVTNVSGTQRELSSAPAGALGMTRTGFTDVTGPGELGPSSPSGPKDAEIYTTTVLPGEAFTMTANGTGGTEGVYDFDMVLYRGVAETYDASMELATSGNEFALGETLTWENQTGAPVQVSAIVYGWAVGHSQPFTYTSSHGLLDLDYDGYVLADNLLI